MPKCILSIDFDDEGNLTCVDDRGFIVEGLKSVDLKHRYVSGPEGNIVFDASIDLSKLRSIVKADKVKNNKGNGKN